MIYDANRDDQCHVCQAGRHARNFTVAIFGVTWQHAIIVISVTLHCCHFGGYVQRFVISIIVAIFGVRAIL